MLTEVYDPSEQRWVFWDPDLGCRLRQGGRYLDLEEACRSYLAGHQVDFKFLARPGIDTADAPKNDPYSLMFEEMFRSDAARHMGYRRLLQVPLIEGYSTLDTEAQKERARALNCAGTILDRAAFRTRFYTGV